VSASSDESFVLEVLAAMEQLGTGCASETEPVHASKGLQEL
jgi:hypothetical protein